MLILASASPRRHALLSAAGIEHIVRPPDISEQRWPQEDALAYVKRLAEEKARAVDCGPQDVVLGADTVVSLDDLILGKPMDVADARRMLRLLSGREHLVRTGICLLSGHASIIDCAETKVRFETLTENEIEEYTRSGEPSDKAGAYAIQGLAAKFVRAIEGCYYNVVGLPVSLIYQRLKQL